MANSSFSIPFLGGTAGVGGLPFFGGADQSAQVPHAKAKSTITNLQYIYALGSTVRDTGQTATSEPTSALGNIAKVAETAKSNIPLAIAVTVAVLLVVFLFLRK